MNKEVPNIKPSENNGSGIKPKGNEGAGRRRTG